MTAFTIAIIAAYAFVASTILSIAGGRLADYQTKRRKEAFMKIAPK